MSRDALIVGINQYLSQSLKDLKAPALDAEAIAQRLEEDGDFDTLYRLPERITEGETKKPLVSDTHPVTREQLEQALEKLFLPGSSQAPDTALFYFSGHGIPDQKGFDKGYLATSDTNPDQSHSGLSLRWLQWLLSESTVKQQIIWLDCCHSGSLLVKVEAANPGHGESKDRCFITSSRDFEQSWEDLNSPYSVLTKALLDGLDPKRLPGRWIDTFALVDHVNQALKGELQKPVCTNFGDAINLTRSWQVQEESTSESQGDSGICPYKGLEFFDCNDEDPKYFFGREQLVGQLLDQVRTSNFMALVGASGNGKSSVLRAGLLHQLKLGRRISGSDQWRIRITQPDRQPMRNLALAFVEEGLSDLDRAAELDKASGLLKEGAAGLQRLVQVSSAPRTVLVIDQFEEVFTRCENQEEREQFFACLMGALSDVDNKLCLIIAMRADFIVKCMEQEYSGLARQIDQQMVSVLPMQVNELRAAICRPAEQVNLQVEPALVTEILNDIDGAPGSLPLLQYTLKELWQQHQDNYLNLASYQALGGIQGTLDQRATAIYDEFEKAEQRTVQHIFQQLTQLGEGTEDTRRRVFQTDLVADPKHSSRRVQQVIERLSSPENRLIVTSEVVSKSDQSTRMSIVDVAHEALIRHWKLLRQWIEQNRDLLRKQRRIEASAISWRNQGQKSGYLLQGLPLIEAIQLNKEQTETFPLSDNARIFIQTSLRQRRLNRLKTGAWLIIPAFILFVVMEHNIRESSVKQNYALLSGEGNYAEKQAVESLVRGCIEKKIFYDMPWFPNYLVERIFGPCRSLHKAPLEKANLYKSNLSNVNLSSATLHRANLSSTNLSDTNLNRANLTSATLHKTNLYNANLHNANLHNANLYKSNLSKAILHRADLTSTVLRNANLSGANLSGANLSGANLRGANLRGVNLRGVNLRDANLTSIDLTSTDLHYANLRHAIISDETQMDSKWKLVHQLVNKGGVKDLSSADLSSVSFINADLSNTNLIGADLSYTNLISANLMDADLSRTDLSRAILLNTDLRKNQNLTQAQLEGKEQPYICNSPLPQNIKIGLNRDCRKVAALLSQRYPQVFSSLDSAQKFVDEQRQRKWD